jgi:1,4-dihydroxy-2-naphthoate octaprenyltransferase
MKGAMKTETAIAKLASYPRVVASWIGDDGYPMQTPATFETQDGALRLHATGIAIPTDREVNLIGSHIRPQPGTGYDERRYVLLWGRASDAGDGTRTFAPERAWGWDEAETPFFEYSERSNGRAKSYMRRLSEERGVPVKPRLSRFWTFFLATRLPFLTATLVPVLLGLAVAGREGYWHPWLALLTVAGACAVHIGLNVANDFFDTLSGADDANVNPTQYSGGSRVIQHGLMTLRQVGLLSLSAYVIGGTIGVYLVVARGSLELLGIGVAGIVLSVFYTAPPLRLVHRGLGEVTTALGFGPIMVLGAYVVQTQHLAWEPVLASIPVAILIALVLYVNEIPDRASDAAAGKRTLPVRFSRDAITNGFLVAALAAFATIAVLAAPGIIPRPTIVALLAMPLVFEIYRGIRSEYSSPYTLMGVMGKNVQLHLVVGVLLLVGYTAAIVAGVTLDSPPGLLT